MPCRPVQANRRQILWGISPFLFAISAAIACGLARQELAPDTATTVAEVSFFHDVRPILQARCAGCHQEALKSGEFVLTSHATLLAGGASGDAAIVPAEPAASPLLDLITPVDGEASMPPDGPPLTGDELDIIRRWIEEGARDDSPATTAAWTTTNPPVYHARPVITALDVSPDGKWLAVSGWHEVLVLDASTQQLSKRLVGRSPRIEALAFSPDGTRLAVAGGQQGEFGEVQVWEVETGSLVLSRALTADTLSGVSWSHDGKLLAVGCTDNSARALDSSTGEQVLLQKASEDQVRDTVFSVDSSHLISAGRDMTCKLTEVATQRFVDNITSITPGVLKGGIAGVARHPQRDEIVVASADGAPKIYRVFRETKRVIGDDANLIRRFPAMPGRLQAVAASHDGRRFAVVSSLDGSGQLDVWSWDFDTSHPDDVKAINSSVVTGRSPEQNARLEQFLTSDLQLAARQSTPQSGLYTVAFSGDDSLVYAAGQDGLVRAIDVTNGEVRAEFSPFPAEGSDANSQGSDANSRSLRRELGSDPLLALAWDPKKHQTPRPISSGSDTTPITRLAISPGEFQLDRLTGYVQLVVTAWDDQNRAIDVTHQCRLECGAEGLIDERATFFPLAAGSTEVRATFGGQSATAQISTELQPDQPVSFIRDVNPLLGRLGCNAGTCHGSQGGQRGFKLSLRGYDPIFDVRALTDDLSSRRINVAAPEQSLMLLKATASVPHQGGQVLRHGDRAWSLVRNWIAAGAKLDLDVPRVARIEIEPAAPVLDLPGLQQQLRVVAHYSDGSRRDVSREAFLDSSSTDVATIDGQLRVTAQRRGEAALLARYEGSFAAATLTVMGDRTGFAWTDPPVWNRIDELVAAKWQRMKIEPAGVADDAAWLRRISLDLTGLPPTPQQVRSFLADPRPAEAKRPELLETLLASESFTDHWTNKWADLLQVNRKFLDVEGSAAFRDWIRGQVANNVPWNQFAHSIITASGSTKENPAAAYYKILRTPDQVMENTTHLFLGIRFNCNKCHDHPFERWTQDQYYEMAAWFAQVNRSADPAGGDRRIGGSDVEASTPLYEIIADAGSGEVIHERTRLVSAPAFPFDAGEISRGLTPFHGVFGEKWGLTPSSSRREQFAAWLTTSDNPWFARSVVNRYWSYLLGKGLIEPVDDIRAGNPPANPELLDHLTEEFVASGFDLRQLVRMICSSRTYQLAATTNRWNEDDRTNYSRAVPRRLPAEVLFDSISAVTGTAADFPGLPAGLRAGQLPDAGAGPASGVLATLGRPARESVCECDRSSEMQLGSVLALVSGPDQARAIQKPDGGIAALVNQFVDNRELVGELYLQILGRSAGAEEIESALPLFDEVATDHQRLAARRAERVPLAAEDVAGRETARQTALTEAGVELTAKIASIDPGLLQREADREAELVRLKAALAELDANREARFAAWRKQQLSESLWYPLRASEVTQTSGAVTENLPDRSLLVRANKGNTVTTVMSRTDQPRIAAVRLETLTDPALPMNGPGLAPNGNFVINELELEVASPAAPDDWKKVAFASAAADFAQESFPAERLFNGSREPYDGWAIVPQTGQPHWVTLQLAEPVEQLSSIAPSAPGPSQNLHFTKMSFPRPFPGPVQGVFFPSDGWLAGLSRGAIEDNCSTNQSSSGWLVRFTLVHTYPDGEHIPGRIRLSLSSLSGQVGPGLSEELIASLAADPAVWAPELATRFQQLFDSTSPELAALKTGLATAELPLMIDATIVSARSLVTRLSVSTLPDPLLEQLNRDLALSEQQLASARLTAAQDLTWALINSPAFLFNH